MFPFYQVAVQKSRKLLWPTIGSRIRVYFTATPAYRPHAFVMPDLPLVYNPSLFRVALFT